jgi:hypothetical protein
MEKFQFVQSHNNYKKNNNVKQLNYLPKEWENKGITRVWQGLRNGNGIETGRNLPDQNQIICGYFFLTVSLFSSIAFRVETMTA